MAGPEVQGHPLPAAEVGYARGATEERARQLLALQDRLRSGSWRLKASQPVSQAAWRTAIHRAASLQAGQAADWHPVVGVWAWAATDVAEAYAREGRHRRDEDWFAFLDRAAASSRALRRSFAIWASDCNWLTT